MLGKILYPMIIWTHIYDLIAKLTAFAVMIATIILSTKIESFEASMLCLALGIVSAGLLWWFLLRPLSSFLYAKCTLGAPITFPEAKLVSCLFSPIKNMAKWHPLKEVKTLPIDQKVSAIMIARGSVISHHTARDSEWKNAPLWAKSLRIILGTLLVVSMLGAFFNIWPFYYTSILQARLLDGSYYPLVSAVIWAIPFGIAIKVLEKKLGIRSL